MEVGITYTLSNSQQNNAGPLVNLGSVVGSRSIYPYAQLADEDGNALAFLTIIDAALWRRQGMENC